MIISHKHRYIFIEMPHTASTGISRELCQHYDGEPILHKHAHYYEFLKLASPVEKTYFSFAGIRNPLDIAVTLFFKYKTNHQNFYTDQKYLQINGGHVSSQELREFHFITDNNASFSDYLLKFYRLPYDSWGSPRPHQFDFIIRYEYLQKDFAHLLHLLNIKQNRPLPTVNKTDQKPENFWSYYSPETYQQVQFVFGAYMKIWNYKTPISWGDFQITQLNYLTFKLLEMLRKNLVWGSNIYANLFRKLRNAFPDFLP
ncbi:MAG: sulfotransferase family 2 domain-containing protein [Anaerolineaceae bacterium]|nr:sulfotransferase family 2 domain-containing protein [Anaerolineaceae bacterium]